MKNGAKFIAKHVDKIMESIKNDREKKGNCQICLVNIDILTAPQVSKKMKVSDYVELEAVEVNFIDD